MKDFLNIKNLRDLIFLNKIDVSISKNFYN